MQVECVYRIICECVIVKFYFENFSDYLIAGQNTKPLGTLIEKIEKIEKIETRPTFEMS